MLTNGLVVYTCFQMLNSICKRLNAIKNRFVNIRTAYKCLQTNVISSEALKFALTAYKWIQVTTRDTLWYIRLAGISQNKVAKLQIICSRLNLHPLHLIRTAPVPFLSSSKIHYDSLLCLRPTHSWQFSMHDHSLKIV